MRIGRLSIEAKRWPWQKDRPPTILPGMDRFGGGWAWKLGVDVSRPSRFGMTVVLNLVWGLVAVGWQGPASRDLEEKLRRKREILKNLTNDPPHRGDTVDVPRPRGRSTSP